MAPGCRSTTFGGKPYCYEHVELMPAARAIAAGRRSPRAPERPVAIREEPRPRAATKRVEPTSAKCARCGLVKPIKARGLCGACFWEGIQPVVEQPGTAPAKARTVERPSLVRRMWALLERREQLTDEERAELVAGAEELRARITRLRSSGREVDVELTPELERVLAEIGAPKAPERAAAIEPQEDAVAKTRPIGRKPNVWGEGLSAEWLREQRIAHGLTQPGLGARVDARAASICQWEGGRNAPSRAMQEKLREAFSGVVPACPQPALAPAPVPQPPAKACEVCGAAVPPAESSNRPRIYYCSRACCVAAADRRRRNKPIDQGAPPRGSAPPLALRPAAAPPPPPAPDPVARGRDRARSALGWIAQGLTRAAAVLERIASGP